MDDGDGFDDTNNHFKQSIGIIGMKERIRPLNGNFDIQSQIGKGTKINISH